MPRPEKLSTAQIAAFLADHPGWAISGGALVRTFAFADYPTGIAFVVQVGFAAEKHDHHPELHLGYRKVTATWSTHDVGGITALDTELGAICDRLHRG
ncbi:MAG: 4a-hydroxytetrahydrobiopterin dehydratase [Minicystis sp.]